MWKRRTGNSNDQFMTILDIGGRWGRRNRLRLLSHCRRGGSKNSAGIGNTFDRAETSEQVYQFLNAFNLLSSFILQFLLLLLLLSPSRFSVEKNKSVVNGAECQGRAHWANFQTFNFLSFFTICSSTCSSYDHSSPAPSSQLPIRPGRNHSRHCESVDSFITHTHTQIQLTVS